MKKLIIFDFDGTLVDTITDVGICFNKALTEHNFCPIELEDYKMKVGGDLEAIVLKLLGSENATKDNINKVKKSFEQNYLSDKKENTKPYRGITEMLKTLQKKGFILAINSNKKINLLKNLNNKFFSDIYFIDITGYEENTPSKPNPTKVNNTIKLSNVTKEETIYIGDTTSDIKTAKNAGIDCILVSWGQAKPEDFTNNYVKKVINKPSELLKSLGEL